MKKKILTLIMVVTIVLGLAGCAPTTAERVGSDDSSMFVVIETTTDWDIVYHKETKVMYAVGGGTTKTTGVFTVLVNADGRPMLYEK